MITEEFSFPIITTSNVVRLTVLPPLWRITSINHPDPAELEQENGRKKKIFRSFSEVEDQINKTENDAEKAEAAEEKMDMLWEEFNDELQGNSITSISMDNSSSDSGTDHIYHNNDFGKEFQSADQDRCNSVRDQSKTLCIKKKKLELVVKMVKKLFLLQNMARIKKRGPIHS